MVGQLRALVWDLPSASDAAPPEDALHQGWELAMGGWELDESADEPVIWQPAKAPCLLELGTTAGEPVVGALQALLLPVTAELLKRL